MFHSLKQVIKTLIQEFKRLLCWNNISSQIFTVNDFGKLRFICGNRTEYYRSVEFGGEKKSLASFLFMLEPDDVVWDIGASIGLFATHAASIVKKVVAFEPDPATFNRLKQNVDLNGFTSKVVLHQIALGSEQGKITLQTDGLDGNAPSIANLGRHKHAVEVEIATIDKLVKEGEIAPTVLKIDIEWAEILALRGAKDFLKSSAKPRLLFIEVHPTFLGNYNSDASEVENIVKESGYKTIGINRRGEQFHIIAFSQD